MLATDSPFPMYFDIDGSPLDGGSIYYGTANGNPETSPITVYWDEAGTQPAAQPIRTRNGFTMRDGTAANVFAGVDYSLTVKNSRGQQVVYVKDSSSFSSAVAAQAAVAALSADLADPNASDKGDDLIAVKRLVAGAAASTVHEWIEARDEFNVVGEFGALADGSDQTAKVQAVLDALGVDGGTVAVPRGCKFNIRALIFPKRSNLSYWRDDDTSPARPAGQIGTSERMFFAANSDGTGAGQGVVNESRLEAAFHPGHIINVRKDIAGHDAWLGPGQSRTSPARASLLIQDEETTAAWLRYEAHSTQSNFSGVTLLGARRVYTLTGVGSSGAPTDWGATLPAVGDLITGVTSGATGLLLSLDANSTTVLWVSGVFAVGERLTNGAQTPTDTLSAVAYAETVFPGLAFDLKKGYWSIGLPPGVPTDQFAVGGRVTSTRTRTMGQHLEETVNDPGFCWVDSYEAAAPAGFFICYDTSVAAALRRLYKRKFGETVNRQLIGSFSAGCTFDGSLAVSPGGHNVISITTVGTGRYVVNFATALDSSQYLADVQSLDTTLADRFQRVTAKTTTSVEIRNYNAAGTLANLVGSLDVKIHLGDI